MKFKETEYVLNSEIKRISFILADVLSEKYDSMADRIATEYGLGYRDVDSEVQRLIKLIGITDDRSDQDDDNEPRRTSG